MTTDKDKVSALRVQRDSAHRQLAKLDAENRWLRKHQAEIRVWLAGAITQWETARETYQAGAVADEIHRQATTLLGDVQAHLEGLQ